MKKLAEIRKNITEEMTTAAVSGAGDSGEAFVPKNRKPLILRRRKKESE
jgi:hypothetical protein